MPVDFVNWLVSEFHGESMIHAHLKSVATLVDEEKYQVRFQDNLSFKANESFRDGDGLDPAWMKGIWWGIFQMKLSAVAVTVKPGQSVLDICCGQGFLGDYFDEGGAVVTYADLSPFQLASLTGRLRAAGKSPRACRADLLNLPFADDSVDAVIGNSFLHHIPDVPAGLQEVYRVLKPGGTLIVFHEPSASANWWETFPLSVVRDTSYKSGFTDLWQFREHSLRGVLAGSGFANVRIIGSGILGALFCNWYLILVSKLRITSRIIVKPALLLRSLLSKSELVFAPRVRADNFPSLFIVATKEGPEMQRHDSKKR